jgi:phage terminase large subunit
LSNPQINHKFIPLFEEGKRYYVVTGGRNSSKSFSVKTWEAYKLAQKGNKILDTRYTLSSAGKSIIPEFINKLELIGIDRACKITQSDITCNNGSQVLFSGIKTSAGIQTANLKSLEGINIWVMDEAEEMISEDTFDKIDLSIRQPGKNNIVVLILNPTTKEHFIWKRWFEGYLKYINIDGFNIPVSTHPDICHIHTTYLDNIDNIPDDYLKQIEKIKETNPEKYRHVILGGWLEKSEGAIFTNWKIGEFNNSLPYIHGLDFGFYPDPDACIKFALDRKNKQIYLHEVFYKNSQGTEQLKQSLKREIKPFELIVGDSAEKRLINDLSGSFNIKPVIKKPGQVVESIKLIQDYELIVTPTSQNLIKELNNYAWHDKKANIPIDNYNHLLDAMRYCYIELNNKPAAMY